ncbi:MAG: ribose 5-phosphate isomerase A [Methanomicrobia archaeon]|nr:ribose 5-phosphate isomerase A [Methanomicrobia archaeon]
MLKKLVGKYAADLVKDGDVIGLGTGSTTLEFINSLGERIKKEEIEVYGVPTSFQSKILGIENNITIVSIDQYPPEKAFDGADEVDPHNFLIKGRGAAILQEKIIDYASKEFYVLIDESKLVKNLGEKAKIPIEVLPHAWKIVSEKLKDLNPELRMAVHKDGPVITDNGNFIIDLTFLVDNPEEKEKELNNIPGVVENGIFTQKCVVLLGTKEGVKKL